MKKVAFTTLKFGIPAVVLVLTMHVAYKSAHAQMYSDWSAPINLGPTVNSTSNDITPAISKDGLSLYFTSTRLGGFGGDDIYVSQRNSSDDPWGPPVNLGPTINTTFNEREPAFSRDGHLMFFATDRLSGGFGSTDIWVSRRVHTHNDFVWQTPENLGAGVNSANLDTGPSYFANEEVGTPQLYFSSNRPGGPIFSVYVSEQAADGSFGPAFLIPELGVAIAAQITTSIRHDGLEIFLNSNRPGSFGNQDLWVSTRETVLDAWSEPVNLGATVNSTSADVTPDISSDRETLFFASSRPGGLGVDLYMSTRTKLSEKTDLAQSSGW
jgi:Tol biopolymer transport system component